VCVVSELLPVALTPDDIEHNPEFCKLLKALTKHILSSGAFAPSEEDVREVSAMLLFMHVAANIVVVFQCNFYMTLDRLCNHCL